MVKTFEQLHEHQDYVNGIENLIKTKYHKSAHFKIAVDSLISLKLTSKELRQAADIAATLIDYNLQYLLVNKSAPVPELAESHT